MTTTSTAALVENVLSAMRGAATAGDPDAASALGGMVPPEGKASPGSKPSTPVPAEATAVGPITVLRPNGEEYHVRKLGMKTDVQVLQDCRVIEMNVMLYGAPGTGKTALIEAAYAPRTLGPDGEPLETSAPPVYTVQGSGDTEVSDFIGGYVPLPGGAFEWVDGPLLRAMEEGAVLYIDEIALIDPKVMAIVYGVMDGRGELRISQNPARGIVTSKPGFYVCAACNPNAPGARMSEALLSRFGLQFEVTTDHGLARKMGVNTKAVTAALNLAKKMQSGEISWAPQLRELINFKKVESRFGTGFACNNLVSNAPELDRPVVADVLTRAFGQAVTELKLA